MDMDEQSDEDASDHMNDANPNDNVAIVERVLKLISISRERIAKSAELVGMETL